MESFENFLIVLTAEVFVLFLVPSVALDSLAVLLAAFSPVILDVMNTG